MDQLYRPFRNALTLLTSDQRGAVLVEFAIAANIMILVNILTYDFASYYRLSQQIKHATQFVQATIANDADHVLTKADLENQIQYLDHVTGLKDFKLSGSLIVIDAMPLYSKAGSNWTLLVCWSWSSNPSFKAAPPAGTFLSPDPYRADLWAPAAGVSASSAIVLVEAYQKNQTLLDMSLVPNVSVQRYVGPVRYIPNQKINLMLFDSGTGSNLNNATLREPSPSNAIACQR